MGNLTIALVFVITLNVLMFLVQAATLDINPDAPNFFTNEGTMLDRFDAGGNILDTGSISTQIPQNEVNINPTTGNLFTDTFSSMKKWFGESTGVNYIFSILAAPYNMVKSINLPNAFTFAIGTLWYAITLFLIVAFIWGRDV